MKLNRGELNRRITIKYKVATANAETNDEEIVWTTLRSVWAKRMGPKTSEMFEANQQVSNSQVRFLMGYQGSPNFATAISDNMLIDDNGTEYQVKGTETVGDNEATILTAEKRDNE